MLAVFTVGGKMKEDMWLIAASETGKHSVFDVYIRSENFGILALMIVRDGDTLPYLLFFLKGVRSILQCP